MNEELSDNSIYTILITETGHQRLIDATENSDYTTRPNSKILERIIRRKKTQEQRCS